MPFPATWGVPGTLDVLNVVVPGVAEANERDDVPADQLWAQGTSGVNAIVLDDDRAYVAGGGLPLDEHEEA